MNGGSKLETVFSHYACIFFYIIKSVWQRNKLQSEGNSGLHRTANVQAWKVSMVHFLWKLLSLPLCNMIVDFLDMPAKTTIALILIDDWEVKKQSSRISKCPYVVHTVFLMLMSSFLSFFAHSCRTSNRKTLMGNGQSPALPRPHSPLSAHAGDFISMLILLLLNTWCLYEERKADRFSILLLLFPLFAAAKSCVLFHPNFFLDL